MNTPTAFQLLEQGQKGYTPNLIVQEVGVIQSINKGIVIVSGLPGVGFEEVVKFKGWHFGIAFNLDADQVGVVLLGESSDLQVGQIVERTGRVMDIGVGEEYIGRVITPLGEPLDIKQPIIPNLRYPVERPAPAIMDRSPVQKPLQTGIKVIDALIPIGRGQRQLIMGDRQTGKTAIAVDTILNQKGKNVLCIYCAIGQRASAITRVIATLTENDAMAYTIVMVTEGSNAPGLLYIAPYAATSMAEYFMERGHDVLIVYDDLTNHARAYREISLLLKRPPGREAFPGDIFYIHSRLLERSTHLSIEKGGGSLTALPIIETEAQNLSAYIPTNLISITDGQLYLNPKLFELAILPAIDVEMSVSRVGGNAQLAAIRQIAGNLKLDYAQFEELESFARFGTHLDDSTLKIIEHGKRIRSCLTQPEKKPLPVASQLLILIALTNHCLDNIELNRIVKVQEIIAASANQLPEDLTNRLAAVGKLTNDDIIELVKFVQQLLQTIP